MKEFTLCLEGYSFVRTVTELEFWSGADVSAQDSPQVSGRTSDVSYAEAIVAVGKPKCVCTGTSVNDFILDRIAQQPERPIQSAIGHCHPASLSSALKSTRRVRGALPLVPLTDPWTSCSNSRHLGALRPTAILRVVSDHHPIRSRGVIVARLNLPG